MFAWRTIANGVTHQTATTRQKYWMHWCTYCAECKTNPFLQDETPINQSIILTGYAARVRTGAYGYQNEVTVQTVSTALAAVTASIELGGQRSPALQSEGTYIAPIKQQLEGFRRDDPPAIPQLAVPSSLIRHIYETYATSSNAIVAATADLIIIAFYYLLRVGEYTKPRTVTINGQIKRATRTKQFCVGDVGFFKHTKVLPRRSSSKVLPTADSATLKISNQKNGKMGQTVHQESTGKTGAVAALARRVHHILSNKGSERNLICDVFDNGKWSSVTSSNIVKMVRQSAADLNLHEKGIDPDLIGSHSLRAGGAMALKLHNYADTTIQKLGRWSSAI